MVPCHERSLNSMFSVDPASSRTLDSFCNYLEKMPVFWLTADSKARPVEKRVLQKHDILLLFKKFSSGQKATGIGARHGQPMLLHFILKPEKPGVFIFDEVLIEDLRDIERLIGYAFAFVTGFLKTEISLLKFSCGVQLESDIFHIKKEKRYFTIRKKAL